MIETQRLIIRNFRDEDWERVHLYGSLPDFSQYEAWGPNTLEDTKKYIAEMVAQALDPQRFQFELAVCLKEKDFLIGGCGIRREGEFSRVANLGWAINPEFQGRGYATEAAKALIEFGFEKLNLKVIFATCDSRNAASYRVMEKLGMQRVGFIKGDKMQKGHMRDTYRYEITER
jgi:ribosomal-protein-alanine N-acetyltransferase